MDLLAVQGTLNLTLAGAKLKPGSIPSLTSCSGWLSPRKLQAALEQDEGTLEQLSRPWMKATHSGEPRSPGEQPTLCPDTCQLQVMMAGRCPGLALRRHLNVILCCCSVAKWCLTLQPCWL